MSLIENYIQNNNLTIKNFTYNRHSTFIIHVSNEIAVEVLLFIKPRSTTNIQSVRHRINKSMETSDHGKSHCIKGPGATENGLTDLKNAGVIILFILNLS